MKIKQIRNATLRINFGGTVIASHMDTVAHASLTRKTLRAALERCGLAGRVLMPGDGEECVF